MALLESAMSAFEQMGMTWHLGEALQLRQQITRRLDGRD